MNDQPALFDPERTVPKSCPVPGCGAIAYPNQTKVVTCHIDRERITGWVSRPKTCLNTVDPATEPIPY